MTTAIYWFLYLVIGCALGMFYFGVLWLTVRRLQEVKHPIPFTLGSFFGRIVITVAIFYLLTRAGGWQGLLISLLGFTVMRFVLVRYWGPEKKYVEKNTGQR